MSDTGERTLVLALGNPLRGDDGVGAAILEGLRALPLPGDVVLCEGGTPGLETVLLLQGYEKVLIVDAAEMGWPPGEYCRFVPDEVHLPVRDLALRGTLHYAGLAEALALAGALNLLPPQVVIFGVQPEAVGWDPGLSQQVRAAVPAVCRAILKELEDGESTGC